MKQISDYCKNCKQFQSCTDSKSVSCDDYDPIIRPEEKTKYKYVK